MAGPSIVATTKLESASGGSCSGTVTWTAGNVLVVVAACRSTSTQPTVSGGGGTWTKDTGGANSTTVSGSISSNPNPSGTSATITVTGAGSGACTAIVYEISPGGNIAKDATSPTANTGTASPGNTGTLSNTKANALFIAGLASSSSSTTATMTGTSTGWTYPTAGKETNGFLGCVVGSGYKAVSVVAAESSSWTVTATGWVGLIAVYSSTAAALWAFLDDDMSNFDGMAM